jgi:hypothetical protein
MSAKAPQWVLIAGALIVWSLWRAPTFAAPVIAYLLVWAIGSRLDLAWSRRATAIAILAGAAALASMVMGRHDEILETEQLDDIDRVLADRWRLAEVPSIAPPVAYADRPTTHYLFAPEGSRVALRFIGSNRDIVADALGHGLFRAVIDPERDGPLSQALELEVDGVAHRRTIAVIRPTAHPRALTAKDGIAAAISTETDELYVLDGELSRITVEDRPVDAAILDRARIAVIHETGTVVLLERDRAVARIDLSGPLSHVALAPDGRLAIGRSTSIAWVSTSSLAAAGEVPLPFPPDRIAFAADGALLVSSAPTRSIHRFAGGIETARVFFGRPVVTMATSPDGARLYAAITDYRPDDDAGPNHHLDDQIVELDTTSLRILRRIPTPPHRSPYAIAASEDRIAIAFVGSDEVIRYDRSSFSEIDRFAFDRPTDVVELDGDPIIASAANGRLGDVVLDRPDPTLLAGERAFYEATRAGPSCQSCHLHGGSDFSLHDIGHGDPRPTLSPRGSARTAPYLRGASYPSIAALEAFTTYVLRGYEEDIPDRARSLEAYVASLPRAPARPSADLDTLRTGVDAFVEAGCSFCHRFPAFTDLSQFPEGFLFPERADELRLLDTPSLIGVADQSPYLYDGRAKTLEEVLIDDNQARRHGNAAGLSDDRRAALLALLRSL